MKKMTLIILTGLFALAGPAFSQTIPPYAAGDGDAPQSIPAPIDREKDTPCRPGCYAVEGGITGYYESGKYYNTDRTSTQYVQIRDSKAKKYAPWGIQLNPSAEFFLIKNVAVGGIAEFGYDKMGSDSRTRIGIGPQFGFYYPTQKGLIPYFTVFGLYEHTNDYWASTKSMYWTDQAMKGGIRMGLISMLSRQGGIFGEVRFTYEFHYTTDPTVGTKQTSSTGFNVQLVGGYKYFIF